jgi:hypothetical protein
MDFNRNWMEKCEFDLSGSGRDQCWTFVNTVMNFRSP